MASSRLSMQGQGAVFVGSSSIVVGTDAAAAESDYTIADANAAVGDIVMCSLDNAGMETGMSIAGAWVSAAGSIKIRTSNLNAAAALVGGTRTVRYALLRA